MRSAGTTQDSIKPRLQEPSASSACARQTQIQLLQRGQGAAARRQRAWQSSFVQLRQYLGAMKLHPLWARPASQAQHARHNAHNAKDTHLDLCLSLGRRPHTKSSSTSSNAAAPTQLRGCSASVKCDNLLTALSTRRLAKRSSPVKHNDMATAST